MFALIAAGFAIGSTLVLIGYIIYHDYVQCDDKRLDRVFDEFDEDEN